MSLSPYHEKYAARSDEDMQMRADVKEEELKNIFNQVDWNPDADTIKVFIVGCGERRFIGHHKRIIEKLTGKAVDLTTSDITIEHLEGEEGVIKHDATKPFPSGPYDIVYAHVFLKFINTELQWNVVKNSYDALSEDGIAIHVFDREEINSNETVLSDGMYAVPLEDLKTKLENEGIKYDVIEWVIEDILPKPLLGLALVIIK